MKDNHLKFRFYDEVLVVMKFDRSSRSNCLTDTETKGVISFIDLNQISSSMQPPNHLSILLFSTLILMATHVQSLHLHSENTQNQKEYNQDSYLSELANIQQRLSKDVLSIQQKFTAINLRLSNTNISDSEKLIFLQENLANERDSLFNLQTYLNVPFALRSCQCLNVTEKQKKDLEAQIQDVQASINALQTALDGPYENPKCPNGKCAAVQAINSEIAQMRSYVKIMSDTATSECCKVVNYVYRDNLQADGNNWVYGSTNESQYRLSIFNQSQGANLTQCPADKPMANLTTNQCFACPSNTPNFNLGSRKCEPTCEAQSLVFIEADHRCDYNRTCGQGKYFDQKTHKCQVDLGTDSSCPKDKPVWNVKTLSCNKCDNSTPYFDTNIMSCRPCTENEKWQEYTEECLDKSLILVDCKEGQYYEKETKRCLTIPATKPPGGAGGGTKIGQGSGPSKNPTGPGTTTPTGPSSGGSPSSGTYSQCPPSTPFWSTSDLACYQCPDSTPSYNSNTNKCEECPSNTTWSTNTRRCQKQSTQCPSGQSFNQATQKCETSVSCGVNQVYNSATGSCETYSPTGQIGMCPPQSPFWNAKTLYCEKCDQTKPFYNSTAKECQSCQNFSVWDQIKQTCKSTLKKCPAGQSLNMTTNTCEAINCPQDSPLYNYATNKCEPCPQDTKFNNATFICQSLYPQRTNTSVCSTEAPYWNPQKLSCEPCPVGQAPDASKKCQPITAHFASLSSVPRHQLIQDAHKWQQKLHAQIRQNHIMRVGLLNLQE